MNREINQLESALALYAQNPDQTGLLRTIASLIWSQYGAQEAISFYETLVNSSDADDQDLKQLGLCHAEIHQHELALPYYYRAAELNPTMELWINIGFSLYALNRYKDAMNAYQRGLTYQGQPHLIYYNMGLCSEALGQRPDALSYYDKAIELVKESSDSSLRGRMEFALGTCLLEMRRFAESLEHLRIACDLLHDTDHYFNYGYALSKQDRNEEAALQFERSLALNPHHTSAKHMLNAIRGDTSEEPPVGYVEALFDQYAEHFDQSLMNHLEYQLPVLLTQIKEMLPDHLQTITYLLDLGCGTGLLARLEPNLAQHFIGVDLSSNMLDVARASGRYSKLIHGNIVGVDELISERCDLIISMDTLNYLGSHTAIYETCANILTPQGRLVFTVEHVETARFEGGEEQLRKHGYALCTTGRYTHDLDYIESTLRSCGLVIEQRTSMRGRKEKGAWVMQEILVCMLEEAETR